MADNILEVKNLYKEFTVDGQIIPVLNDISFEIERGEFVSLVGFSGCGKSTLLRIISGLETRSSGSIKVNGREVEGPGFDRTMIFQEARLFPWLRTQENIAYGVQDEKARKMGKAALRKLTQKYIELVNLEGFEKAYPSQLSGGMQQRVSIARALIAQPDLLLLDEPFGALDAITRINMQNEILDIWEKNHTSMLLVTHDIDEAIYLSDRIIILSQRPGTIKKIVEIKLSRPRRRTDIEFMEIRRKIFQEFFNESDVDVEYII